MTHINIKDLADRYLAQYERLYNGGDHAPEYMDAVQAGERLLQDQPDTVRALVHEIGDGITSDREVAALWYAAQEIAAIPAKPALAKYIIMPERCRWTEVEATTAEMAYRSQCCWYMPGKRIAVYNTATGETVVYTRQLDSDGNIMDVQIAG